MSGDWPDGESPPRVDGDADAGDPAAPVLAPGVVVTVRPRFGAARAIALLVLTFLAQFVAAIVVIVAGIVVAVGRGRDVSSPEAITNILQQSTLPLLLLSAIGSAVAVVIGGRLLARDTMRDHTASGIGRLTLTKREALTWLATGVASSLVYGAICVWVVPPDPSTPLGPLAKVAASGGWAMAAWALLALVFGPLIEELLFRGLLLHGFTESWGRTPAAIVVTVIFVAMHLFETAAYWPATVAVTAMAVLALTARLRTGSLAAAAAVHFGYNGGIVLMALLGRR